jgi:hypothetical protein
MHSRTTQWRRVNEIEEAVPDGTPDIVKRQMLERLHKRLLPNEPAARGFFAALRYGTNTHAASLV